MSSKERPKIAKLVFEQLQVLRSYHEMADGTGSRVVASVMNLAERCRSWISACNSDESLDSVAGTASVFEGLAERMTAGHDAELAKQRRNLTVIMEALAAQQDQAFEAKKQAEELLEVARRSGANLDERTADAPLATAELARLVGALASLVSQDLLSRAGLVAAIQGLETVQTHRNDAAAVLERQLLLLENWTAAWQALDLAGQAGAAADVLSHPGEVDGARAGQAWGDMPELVWKATGRALSEWLQPPSEGSDEG